MSDNSEDELNCVDGVEETPWILYRNRDEWSDVTPLPQDDGPHPIVAIAYSEKFKDAYDYFRAILKSGEKSDRALALTEDCTWLNPANYTVWQYRREILQALGKDLHDELKYTDKMIKYNSKNYQVWHHRKVIVEWLQDPSDELAFTETILCKDAKNYHAWQHRQWCIQTFNLYDKELEYVEQLLKNDVRNNSAWNQRYFVISNTTKFEKEVIDKEIDFALEKIELANENESAWNYLRGVLLHDPNGLGYNEKVRLKCYRMYESGCRTNHLLACMIDISQETFTTEEFILSPYFVDSAIGLCKALSKKHDKIRRRYWDYIATVLQDKMNEELESD
ncbi:PREDICTED: protein farnesyltransferase/geranylgeranyltransferase type-1 subunit alpha [Dinoponera quadriceps]|uniref:Protein farnesyltransferase/geranylgeranyltransferase type-1 subunit alpha n=1 Tax=Dinoponera quadriceps TaxID=609295 RepID=A0A6P3Y6Z7_DINQU|nr:PREDICTED: protein farnesyltransferase/geranylgeranyltransferase type-1 subunit alpha [Dinoponera quadriceps]